MNIRPTLRRDEPWPSNTRHMAPKYRRELRPDYFPSRFISVPHEATLANDNPSLRYRSDTHPLEPIVVFFLVMVTEPPEALVADVAESRLRPSCGNGATRPSLAVRFFPLG